ncbi:MAG: dienelactone hydrolase family protein [bacterium]|nr:dienelactone hydrolase family protein [bacterium]
MQIANAAVLSRTVDYTLDGLVIEGYLAWDDAASDPRPGVLVVHEWYGLGDNARNRCNMLAELGYVAFAADIYGKGVRPTNNEDAGKVAGKYRADRPLLRARAGAALEQLMQAHGVDATRIAAIGYCFGGMTALELARSGADIAGVVSFHGSYLTDMPALAGHVKAKVLICHGSADPSSPWDTVDKLRAELDSAGADWQLVAYSGAMHSFTNPSANTPERGNAYHADADRRSWQDMQQFFAEIFTEQDDAPVTASR